MQDHTDKLSLLTAKQAATLLNLKPSTLARWRWAGYPQLPFHKLGSAVRYRLDDLEHFIESGARSSTSDSGETR
jgi:excisionase family DNA binding protein